MWSALAFVMCRREKSAHMLVDFSDVLQVNVYSLGATFLKFRRVLNLELPLVDPSLYIHRFAAKLELGDAASAVGATALKVVQRMKRDWIETGRRPAGVCAAALLVSARAHGFHRTQQDVVSALRVCGMTVSKRLADFQATPAAQLTLREFHAQADSTEEQDPPSLLNNVEQKMKGEKGFPCYPRIPDGPPIVFTSTRSLSTNGNGVGPERARARRSTEAPTTSIYHISQKAEAVRVSEERNVRRDQGGLRDPKGRGSGAARDSTKNN